MHIWRIRDRDLSLGQRGLVMGIVNVTPDSFSDGGHFSTQDHAVAHGLKLVDEGADLLDIGGESTRPGATPVPLDDELRRVAPVIAALSQRTNVPLSVDTSKAEVARQCLAAGAHIINDVTALSGDPGMLAVVKETGAGVVLMHMQGTPQTMQLDPRYDDVVAEIAQHLEGRVRDCVAGGVAAECIVVDPGVGFGKRFAHNLEILVRLHELVRLGRPILLGVSRKGFLGKIIGRPVPAEAATASAAVAFYAALRQSAHIFRVHDVAATRDALLVAEALGEAKEKLLI
jgi:dihydropteroate synthase